jgi:hypothetical protein
VLGRSEGKRSEYRINLVGNSDSNLDFALFHRLLGCFVRQMT